MKTPIDLVIQNQWCDKYAQVLFLHCYSQLQYEALRDRVYNAMKQGVKDIKKIKHITAPILGFDLSHPSGESIVNELYEAGISNKDIFSSSWGDEVVISWLLAKHNLKPTAYWFDFLFKESDVGSSSDRHYFMMRCNRPEGRS